MGRIEELNRRLKKLLKTDFVEERHDKYNRHYLRSNSTRIREITELLIAENGKLVAISATDEGIQGFDLVYHFDFSHQERGLMLSVKVRLPRKTPVIESVTKVAWSANWAERELMDLMGIDFEGHPDPRKLFLPYAWPSEEVG
ncbi:MAG: NADH-quinone oxidoreductase subunit C [Candidatus Hodarchaeota archaeon]